jgi:hypothetical protein
MEQLVQNIKRKSLTIEDLSGPVCKTGGILAYLADGDKNYSKEKILITGYRANYVFDNFKSVSVYKDGKSLNIFSYQSINCKKWNVSSY